MRTVLFAAGVALSIPAQAAPLCGGLLGEDNLLLIKKDEARCAWPFTTDLIGLVCLPKAFLGGHAVYAFAKGKLYPLNGNARDAGAPTGYKRGDIHEIAESDHRTAGWIKPGLQLCDRGGTRLR